MYLDFLVAIPCEKGKITTKPKGNAVYVNYELGREYNRDKKYNVPKRVTIGKLAKGSEGMMIPNDKSSRIFQRRNSRRINLTQAGVVA